MEKQKICDKKRMFGISALIIVLVTQLAKADFKFGVPIKVPNVSSSSCDACSAISNDGLELYLMSNRPYGANMDYSDLWVARREAPDEEWDIPVNLGSPVNSSAYEGDPSLSADGLELYFNGALPTMIGITNRPGGYGNSDIWVSSRATKTDPWNEPENLGPTINTSAFEGDVSLTADGLQMVFGSNRPGGFGDVDLYMSTRQTTSDPWEAPVNLGSTINTQLWDSDPEVSVDGLTLIYSSWRSGGYGGADLWMATRPTRDDPWSSPVNLGAIINTYSEEADPSLSADGSMLYFGRGLFNDLGSWDLWQVPIIPIVDLNGDNIVDSADMCIMVDHWGENYPLCDIGPMPWGNGIVDVQDLIVFAEHLFEDYRLIAHWKLDETEGLVAQDSTGDFSGALLGHPLWQSIGGMINGALELDGIDDYVSTPFVLNPADCPFSTFAWIKGGELGQVIISQADTTSDTPRGSITNPGSTWLGINPSDGKLMTGLMDTYFGPLESESVIADNQWHHIGLVYDLDSVCRCLYVDGTEVARDTAPVAGVPSEGGLYFGAGKDLNEKTFFSGLIDDVRIYNVTLTADEIAALAR